MLRPRWIGMLLLCLVVAGIFATLLQWQLSRALATDPVPEGATEEVRPIADVVDPGDYLAGPL
ncbi:MAG TPA: SURF1 family protein, partial [Microbacterium sp.]|nr:SURF1 family protein [Microbacterium sp.]